MRDDLCGGSWEGFDAALRSTPPGNGGLIGLCLDRPKITPVIATTGEFLSREEGGLLLTTAEVWPLRTVLCSIVFNETEKGGLKRLKNSK